MSEKTMVGERVRHWAWLASAVALGLYTGRLLSELFRPGLAVATLISLLCIFIFGFFVRKRPWRQSWPALLLLFYVLYPEPNPRVALAAAGLAVITFILLRKRPRIGEGSNGDKLMIAGAILIGVIFLTLYITTLAPDILPADNGEFQLIATELGVAHPPGFPLYTMLAHLMTRLPVGPTPAYRVNLLSAFTSALTLVLVYMSVFRLTQSTLGGLTTALVLGTSTTFWAQATTANIRSLTALFAALAIYLLIWIRDELEKAKDHEPADQADLNDQPDSDIPTILLLFVFLVVLSLGITHHASLAFMGPIFILYLILLIPRVFKSTRRWPFFFLAILVGLLPLLYLLWRGAAGARGAPDDLNTINGFFNHVLALGFRGDFFYFLEPAVLWERLKVMGNVMIFQFSPVLLVAMAFGLAIMIWRDRLMALLLGGSFVIFTLIAATYRAPQTVEYMMPAYVPATIILGYAVGTLATIDRYLLGKSWPSPVAALFSAVIIVAAIGQAVNRYPSYEALHGDKSTRDYAQKLLDLAPADSMILADWHWVTPLWYLQTVEGFRPDVDSHFVFPTAEPYQETWSRRIAEGLSSGRPVVATHFEEIAYRSLPLPEPIAEAFLFPQEPRLEMPDGFEKSEIQLGEQIRILGYQLEPPTVEVGQETVLTLAWEPLSENYAQITLFAHLVGEDGQLYGHQDLPAPAQSEGMTLTQFRIAPRPGAEPGQLAVMIGAYGQEELLDDNGQARSSVATLELTGSSLPPATQNPTYRILSGESSGTRLVGYDWDQTIPGLQRLYLHWRTEDGYQTEVRDPAVGESVMPDWYGPWGIEVKAPTIKMGKESYYVPLAKGIVWTGRPLSEDKLLSPADAVKLPQNFISSRPVNRDLIVSLRLVGYEKDGFRWEWWYLDDGVPAMGAIPTLKWIAGSHVRDPRWPIVSDLAREGQEIGPLLRLYDAFTNRPLSFLDERLSQVAPWIPLGTAIVKE